MMKAGVIVHERQNCHSAHILKRSDFHFSESQRVPVALPVRPHHTVMVRRCVVAGVVVAAVQVGVMTGVVSTTSHLCIPRLSCVIIIITIINIIIRRTRSTHYIS